MQVSSSDWEESLRKEVLQFEFRSSLFDTVVSSDVIYTFMKIMNVVIVKFKY